MKEIGLRLYLMRRQKGLNQKQVASLVGTSESHVSHMERGNRLPHFDVAIRLADLFDCSLDYLAGRSENPICK